MHLTNRNSHLSGSSITVKFSKNRLSRLATALIILIGPIVDIINGYLIQVVGITTIATPGVIVRGGILMSVMAVVTIKGDKYIRYGLIYFLILFSFSHLFYLVNGKTVDFIGFLSLYAKIIFPFLGFATITYLHKKYPQEEKFYWKVGFGYGLLTAISILAFTFIGFSIPTYSHQAGSSTGLMKAQNETSILLVLSYCLYLFYNYRFQKGNMKLLLLTTVVFAGSVILLSTRSSLLGVPFTFLIFTSFILYQDRKQLTTKQKLAFLTVAVFLVLAGVRLVIFWIENDIFYTIQKFQYLLEGEFRRRVPDGIAQISSFNFFEHLFGVGDINFALVENDLVDIYGKFGLFTLIPLLVGTGYFYWRTAKNLMRKYSPKDLALFLGLSFYIVHGFLAGHAFASAQVGNIIMLVYFLVYFRSSDNLPKKDSYTIFLRKT